jgi:peptidoglycan/LPS O-acetylase OafA/YrhL
MAGIAVGKKDYDFQPGPVQIKPRIGHLDGLRGIAILAVLLFHAYARWPALYPYEKQFVGNPIFDNGVSGVRLFFMISGFVILMTLHRSPSFLHFMKGRWIRLFPAMLICSAIIYATADFFHERPGGSVSLPQLLPGLTFTGAEDGNQMWNWLGDIKSLEGSFWSLYAEMKFYIVFGVAYFCLGEFGAISLLVFLFTAGVLVSRLHFGYTDNSTLAWLYSINFLFRFSEYGWFAAGSLFYLYSISRNRLIWIAGLLLTLASLKFATDWAAASVIFSIAFIAAVVSQRVQRGLSNRLLLFLGAVSYPLYLLHENMLVASISKIGPLIPTTVSYLTPLAPAIAIAAVAWLIAKYAEAPLRNCLTARLI